MANPFFNFKQFSIHHDRCAMKVTTDSCLFGAWSAAAAERYPKNHNVLDIGCGTGLLALMYAQLHPNSNITAVELSYEAAIQAKENIVASPWSNTIQVLTQDIKQYKTNQQWDTIICNPPFYQNYLQSADGQKNIAHHSSELTLDELFMYVDKCLKPTGSFFLLLPYQRKNEALLLAEKKSIYTQTVVNVKQTPKHSYFRTMFRFTRKAPIVIQEMELIIEIQKGTYSEEFKELLKEFYLHL